MNGIWVSWLYFLSESNELPAYCTLLLIAILYFSLLSVLQALSQSEEAVGIIGLQISAQKKKQQGTLDGFVHVNPRILGGAKIENEE